MKKYLIEIYEKIYEWKRIGTLRVLYRVNIMNYKKTIQYIIDNKCSVARFGDGEFDLILHDRDLGFQERSKEISEELLKVLSNKNGKLLICIPSALNSLKGMNDHATNFWVEWGKKQHKKVVSFLKHYSGTTYRFGDNLITRPYIDWVDKKRASEGFKLLKKIWESQDVLIVEGELTRLGVGNDLFSETKSIERILGPSENAFKNYEKLKASIKLHGKNKLVLLALGPTATILASDLCDQGYWVVDIGNVDIEYEWYLRGATTREAIPGKYTNEAKGGRRNFECNDAAYLSQIIDKVSD